MFGLTNCGKMELLTNYTPSRLQSCLTCSCMSRTVISSRRIKHDDKHQTLQAGIVVRCASRMYTSGVIDPKAGILSKFKASLGWTGMMRYQRSKMKLSALRLYLCSVELPEYEQIFQEMRLPDTFNSWARIAELHVWMSFVRLASEGKEGVFIRNNVTKNLWEDLEKRAKVLGGVSITARKDGIKDLAGQFKAALYAYDEGLLGDDRVLAGALWRTFFEMSCDDPERLANMVHYVRKQVHHLESQDSNVILSSGLLTFLPLHGTDADNSRNKHILNEIYNRA